MRGEGTDAEIWVEAPRPSGAEGMAGAREWELVDMRGVSEGEFYWKVNDRLIPDEHQSLPTHPYPRYRHYRLMTPPQNPVHLGGLTGAERQPHFPTNCPTRYWPSRISF